MPIREYRCDPCQETFELLRFPSEEREGDPPCPRCGETMIRQISAPARASGDGGYGGGGYGGGCGGSGGFS